MRRIALAATVIVSLLVGSITIIVASWTSAAGELPPGANGLRGEYFSDPELTNLALSRIDTNVSFNWGAEAPADGVGADNFSVRWTGQVVPRYSESYTFYTLSDDGVRLWVNGQLLIDDWIRHTISERQGTIELQAGQPAELRLEYVEYDANAIVRLRWSSPSQPKVTIPQRRLLTPGGSAEPTPAPTSAAQPPAPTELPPADGTPKLLFGLGAEADGAIESRLASQAPLHMLTSWYNGPNDLSWMTGWKNGLVPRAYAGGYAMHLIVFADGPESRIDTSYGPACGRPYPLSDRFLLDMQQLAQTFAGDASGPPLYVTLFTELQTYACTDNAWNPDAETNAYYRALKDRYMEALAVFHQHAPNARVSLGWGGWQARFDDPSTGAGRSMFQYFDDVMRDSDFQSFQAMQSDGNVDDVRAMTQLLGAYGPVMLVHYKPDNGSAGTFEQDLRAMLTDSYLSELTSAGLFAWSFMDSENLDSSASAYQLVEDAMTRYGSAPR
jgi:hypothetical protein